MKPFIVESINGYTYIDALLFGLFYSITEIEGLLHKNLDGSHKIYLQELISINFVDRIRNNKSVVTKNIETIEQLCTYIGYKAGNMGDIGGFYKFITTVLNNEKISIREHYYKESFLYKKDEDSTYLCDYIPITLIKDGCSIKQAFTAWSDIKIENDMDQDIEYELETITRVITNTPNIITFLVDRWDNNGIKIKHELDISKRFKPDTQLFISGHEWTFLCAICHSGDKKTIGHYYTIFAHLDKYYIYNSTKIPCVQELIQPHDDLIGKLKRDTVMVVYKFVI